MRFREWSRMGQQLNLGRNVLIYSPEYCVRVQFEQVSKQITASQRIDISWVSEKRPIMLMEEKTESGTTFSRDLVSSDL